MTSPPDILYHYCTTATFHAIVSNKSLRLSSLNLSNDTMEGRWANDMFAKACERLGVDPMYRVELKNYVSILPEVWGGLGLCLSDKPDMLSQWRGYADDGFGFCVGFDTKKLLGSVRRQQPNATLVQIEYDEEKQIQSLDRLAREITDIVNQGALAPQEASLISQALQGEEWRNKIRGLKFKLQPMVQQLAPHLYSMKNPAFREESEWRVLSLYLHDDVQGTMSKFDYACSRQKISPFKKIDLEPGDDVIREVFIGPRNITPRDVVRSFLSTKLSTRINPRNSVASYR